MIFFKIVLINIFLVQMQTSTRSTPIATPSATPATPGMVEPISVILQKPLEINEKIKQVAACVQSHSRIVSDAASIVEQLPGLLMLVHEASASTVWLTVESANTLISLFSIHSPTSICRLLLSHQQTSFMFPLQSLPWTVDWSEQFSFFKYLNFRQKSLLNLNNKTIALDAIDYFFFVIGCLGLVPASNIAPAASTGSSSGSWGWGSSSHSTPHVEWYDNGSGSIQERLVMEILEVALTCLTVVSSTVPASLAQKTQLTLSVVEDLYLNLTLFSFNNQGLNFSNIFSFINKIFSLTTKHHGLEIRSHHTGASLPATRFAERYGQVLSQLLETDNFYAEKFLHRIDSGTTRTLAKNWSGYCNPWGSVPASRSSKDAWIKRNADVYSRFLAVLTIPSLKEFVAHFKANSGTDDKLTRFTALNEAKNFVETIVDVISVASPGTGIAEALPSVFLSDTAVEVVSQLWSICVACTWQHSKVPKSMTDASWHMDSLVNAYKALDAENISPESKRLYEIFSWDAVSTYVPEEESDVPKRLSKWVLSKRIKLIAPSSAATSRITWDRPATASEYVVLIELLKKVILILAGVDVEKEPAKYAWVRELGSVSVVTPAAFVAWMYVSVSLCPSIQSGWTVAAIQLLFVVAVGLMGIKWVASQYIV